MVTDEMIVAAAAAYLASVQPGSISLKQALRAALEAAERAAWQPIATAPKDETILVFAAPRDGLPGFMTTCCYHEDAGFCVDELRHPTHWRPLLAPPGAKP